MIRGAARRDRELVELDSLPARDALREQHQQRIEIERDRPVAAVGHVQVVREPAGAGAEHEHAPRCVAAERTFERSGTTRRSPRRPKPSRDVRWRNRS